MAHMQRQLNTQDYAGPRTFTVNETGEILRVDRATVYRLEREGLICSVRVGKRRRYRLEEIERYLAGNSP